MKFCDRINELAEIYPVCLQIKINNAEYSQINVLDIKTKHIFVGINFSLFIIS